MNELLSPAGSLEALQAAVYSGADAVYFGGSVANARMSAANFDNESITDAIKFCRLYGVKSYITVNTAVADCEIPEIIKSQKRENAGFTAKPEGLYLKKIYYNI